jgi:hypothetical protein
VQAVVPCERAATCSDRGCGLRAAMATLQNRSVHMLLAVDLSIIIIIIIIIIA